MHWGWLRGRFTRGYSADYLGSGDVAVVGCDEKRGQKRDLVGGKSVLCVILTSDCPREIVLDLGDDGTAVCQGGES